MNRRRRGLFERVYGGLEFAFRFVVGLILWPFYAALDMLQMLTGTGGPGIRRRSWRDVLLDIVLFIPRWVGFGIMFLYQAMLLWPRIIRLRDLASGLPALLTAVGAVVVLFFLEKDETKMLQAYEYRSNDAYGRSKQEPTAASRMETLKLAQFYSRALVKLKPEDPNYRFNVAYVYQEMGDYARAQSIMDGLAPRYRNGFAKAHLWQADQLLAPDRPLTPDSLDAAEAHLLRALATFNEPEQIHRRLGELYYYRYVRYNPRSIDPRVPSREIYLSKAEYHLSQVAAVDTKLALTLAEIRALQGRSQQAELDVQVLVGQLTSRLANVPDDMATRVQLSRAYRMIRRFADAANVIREGQNLRPDIRYDQELSSIYYYQALDVRQRNPGAMAEQFAALQAAYVAYPTNNYVAHRFIQALTSNSSEETEFARSALQSLVDNKSPGQMATFLLGFDCLRRTLPAKAEDYFRTLRSQKADGTSTVMAGLAMAVLTGQVRSVDPRVVNALFEASLRVWPNDPDLLMVRAQQHLLLKDYSAALRDLSKALEARPKDAKLHEMLAATYQLVGQVDQALKHQQEAARSRSNAQPQPL